MPKFISGIFGATLKVIEKSKSKSKISLLQANLKLGVAFTIVISYIIELKSMIYKEEGVYMLKKMVEKIEKILNGKLDKSNFKEKITKHPNYILKAKEIWNMINEDLGISNTVENKFISKIEKFEKIVLAKFPELTKGDVIELKKSIIGGVNAGKDVVLNQVDHLKQMQIFNTKLKEENEKLKEQLSKFNIDETLEIDKILEKESKILIEEKSDEDK